jgi:riboflavin biosynthesis pyrimidine reductase
MTGQDIRPEGWDARLAALEARRTARSREPLAAVRTIDDRGGALALRRIASPWSAAAFDGPFYETPAAGGLSTGVVFVRSREGNTGTRHPAALGGGAVDEHLVYEGLSRVGADAVIAGAGTLHEEAFFTVWHPELMALRAAIGLPRHPAQVLMSADGSVRPDALLLCNVPSVPVFILTSAAGHSRLAPALAVRPWMTAVAGGSLREQFAALHAAGIRRACAVGGRRSATALVDAGLVQDVYLTTTSVSGGEPGTPWYIGSRARPMQAVVTKAWDGTHGAVRFEHFVMTHGQT